MGIEAKIMMNGIMVAHVSSLILVSRSSKGFRVSNCRFLDSVA